MLKNLLNRKKKKKGFTLIELIIVISILAILGAIAIPNLINVRNNAKKKADITSEATLSSTVQALIADGDITPGTSVKTYDINGANAAASQVVAETSTAATSDEASKIQSALSTVPTPQSTTSNFTVTINTDGTVSVGPAIN